MRFPTFPQPLRLRTITNYRIRILRARSLRSWASEVFTKRIAPGNEHLYNLSIALARLALEPLKDVPSDVPSEISGVLYPSISTNLMGNNLALRPHAVDSSLKLCELQLVRMKRIEHFEDTYTVRPLQIELDMIDTAMSHRSDGRLVWLDENTPLSVISSGHQGKKNHLRETAS